MRRAGSRRATWRAEKPQPADAGPSRSNPPDASSDEFEPPGRERAHAYQEKAVSPALNVRGSVGTFPVADRHLDDLETELGGAEQQIEVTERIEITEVAPIGGDALVLGAWQHLGAAQRVLDRLSEQPGERHAEELVPEEIEEPHRLLLHRVDEPHAVHEFAGPLAERLVEPRQVQIGRASCRE